MRVTEHRMRLCRGIMPGVDLKEPDSLKMDIFVSILL